MESKFLTRERHPKKEVEAVLSELEKLGWSVRIRKKGHAWGLLLCKHNDEECRCGEFCQMSIWSTPKNPGNFANNLRRKALNCIRLDQEDPDDG